MRTSALALTLAPLVAGQAAKYCDPDVSDVCFVEHVEEESGIVYRLAIPAGAGEGFRTALQIVAPVEIGWAGFSYGGNMIEVPLAVTWQNAGEVIASSRITEEYASPLENPDATFTPILSGTVANETHWKTTTVCEGCSSWVKGGTDVALDPAAESVPFAFAYSSEPPTTPDDEASPVMIHDLFGFWSWSLLDAQEERFDEVFPSGPGNVTFRH